jgi:hypothetical protein
MYRSLLAGRDATGTRVAHCPAPDHSSEGRTRENGMRFPMLALALVFAVAPVARGQDNTGPLPPAPEPVEPDGFPWLCFATTITALCGTYVLVRRRERAVEAEYREGRASATAWYCRACARDVSGPQCPDCRAPNPFLTDPLAADTGRKAARQHQAGRGRRD